MKLKLSLLMVALSTYTGLAAADEFTPPPMRDGLWTTHTKQIQHGKTVIDMSIKICHSQALTNSMKATGQEIRKRNNCTSTVTKPSSNSIVEESSCAKGPNAGRVTKLLYTFQGDTGSHMEMHSGAGNSETVMIVDSSYVGSCPAGMKPGDSMMADGKIISGGS